MASDWSAANNLDLWLANLVQHCEWVSWCDQGLIISFTTNYLPNDQIPYPGLCLKSKWFQILLQMCRHNQSCAICCSGCDWALTIIKMCSLALFMSCFMYIGAPLRWAHFIIISSICALPVFSLPKLVICANTKSSSKQLRQVFCNMMFRIWNVTSLFSSLSCFCLDLLILLFFWPYYSTQFIECIL